ITHFTNFQSEGFSEKPMLTCFVASIWLNLLQKSCSKLEEFEGMHPWKFRPWCGGEDKVFCLICQGSFLYKFPFTKITKMPILYRIFKIRSCNFLRRSGKC